VHACVRACVRVQSSGEWMYVHATACVWECREFSWLFPWKTVHSSLYWQ